MFEFAPQSNPMESHIPPAPEEEIEASDSPMELSEDLPDPELFLSEIEDENSRYYEAFRNLQNEGDDTDIEFLEEQHEVLVDLRDMLIHKLSNFALPFSEREKIDEVRSRVSVHLGQLSQLLQPEELTEESKRDNELLH